MAPPVESLSAVSSSLDSGFGPLSGENGVKWHYNTILQTLNAYFPSKHTESRKLLYSEENFAGTESKWENLLVIFTPDGTHLDWVKYKENPVKELNRVNGRIVGANFGARIPEEGARRFEADQVIWDNECNALISEGKLGISTDFNCPIEDDRLIGQVSPNFILVFPMEYQNAQNDLGARIMNTAKDAIDAQKSEETKMDAEIKAAFDEQKTMFNSFIDSIKSLFPQKHANSALSAGDGVTDKMESNMEANITSAVPAVPVEFLEKLTAAEQEASAAKQRAEELSAKVTEFEQTEAQRAEAAKAAEMQRLESLWQTTIITKLPPGLVHEEAAANEIKKVFLESPYDFMGKYSDVINKVEMQTAAQISNSSVGQTHQNSSNPSDKPEIVIPGSFDAVTGKFI